MARIPNAISPEDLLSGIGTPFAPMLIDVRREEAWRAAATTIPAALRRPPAGLEEWSRPLDSGRRIVVYCRLGHEVSQSAAAALRASGRRAVFLSGGIEGYAALGGPLMRRDALPDRDWLAPTRWVTRERPKIDRIACPWLIRRFIDPDARIFFVAAEHVLAAAAELSAIPFDVPDTDFSHEGELCSFDAFIARFGLSHAPLDAVADIVRGADTDRFELAPQAAGLAALSFGLSALHDSDEAAVEAGVTVYDALYAWAARARAETHGWPPAGLAA
jgi:rhodanese-related sulfurtransferase